MSFCPSVSPPVRFLLTFFYFLSHLLLLQALLYIYIFICFSFVMLFCLCLSLPFCLFLIVYIFCICVVIFSVNSLYSSIEVEWTVCPCLSLPFCLFLIVYIFCISVVIFSVSLFIHLSRLNGQFVLLCPSSKTRYQRIFACMWTILSLKVWSVCYMITNHVISEKPNDALTY